MKVFKDGKTGLSWREAKRKHAVNYEECKAAYIQWWEEWVNEQGLLSILKEASGLSDLFGKEGSVCQAAVLWEIRNEHGRDQKRGRSLPG